MKFRSSTFAVAFALSALPAFAAKKEAAAEKPAAPAKALATGISGWLDWRGPNHNGTTDETGLPDKVDGKAALWSANFPGQSSPVIANGKLYINGYVGDGPDLREGVTCFDAETGKQLWQKLENDFLSDTIYLRYSTSSPSIDGETGNVYVLGTQGLLTCFTADGKQLWQHSMMEEYGRLTFPNSRTATPVIDKELVITRGITSAWGAYGPAGDRFYAFDKKTGELVWSSAPGDRPQDNSFSHPLLTWIDGKRVLISAGGDSTLVGINARTGDPLFRFPVAKAGAKGGINAGVVRYKDSLLVIHESENLDTSEVGRSAAFKVPTDIKPPEPGKPQLLDTKELELWRNPLGNLASSPCLAGNRMYEVTGVGELGAIDADTGKVLWKQKLGVEQRQSSPLFGDGKLYVAFYIADAGEKKEGEEASGGNGELFIIKPSDKGPEILSRTKLEGRCYGSPIAYNGKLYVQTDKKLYCFGKKGANKGLAAAPAPEDWPKAGPAAKLQLIPGEAFLKPGESTPVRVRTLDANGFTVEENADVKQVKFEPFIPPTALVKATMKGTFDADGKLVADPAPIPTAGAFKGTLKVGETELSGTMRGRVLPALPIKTDFETAELKETTGPGVGIEPAPLTPPAPGVPAPQPGPTNWNSIEPPTPFAYPPLAWSGARFRFEVRDKDGNKALCKSIDNKLFQRGQVFIGHPEESNYTIEADVMSEGNKRKSTELGLINQRYQIILKPNFQQIEVNSNQERLKVQAPCALSPNIWYHLKARVDLAADGSGIVRAKAWKKDEAEPEAWTIEVPHKTAHTHGAPGLYSLTPQEQRGWIDNISVTPNK